MNNIAISCALSDECYISCGVAHIAMLPIDVKLVLSEKYDLGLNNIVLRNLPTVNNTILLISFIY